MPATQRRAAAWKMSVPTIFAARIGAASGYGVPASVVRGALADAHGPVSTGRCAG